MTATWCRHHTLAGRLPGLLRLTQSIRCSRSSSHESSSSSSSDLGLDPAILDLYRGLKSGERQALARAITLVESTSAAKTSEARKLISVVEKEQQQQTTTTTFRIGLSGPPGAGKSTFIERLGKLLTTSGHRVAVLAVDPSSGTTGGSLLGDKTRMPELTRDPGAFIRPSPSSGHLGGAVILCEFAGYDIVLVETVGVGQSEYLVADMVDMFCLLIPPAGGDELQGIKRGIVEQCDLIVVNKCDGDLIPAARRIKAEYTSALKYMRPKNKLWRPKVKMMSSLTGEGLPKVWEAMTDFQTIMTQNEISSQKRAVQRKKWMWSYVQNRLMEGKTSALEQNVMNYNLSPGAAADQLIETFLKR